MSVPTLQVITERLASMERIELEELAFEYVKSHAAVCRLASGDEQTEPHADDATISRRVGAMSSAGLADMLAPAALVGVSAHELWSHE
jgi:hypothetical protein